MPISLADQQQALLQALWQPRLADAIETIAPCVHPAGALGVARLERGLQAYRSNGRALAQRVLAGAYPVVAELIGDESFEALARHLWQCHPLERGDLAQWGGALASFVESLPDLVREEPYLADVARVEWALHCAATAADAQADPASFNLLTTSDPARLTLLLGSGVACVDSRYPVVSILNAHTEGDPTLEEAGRRLRAQQAECALVWRQGFKPMLRPAQPGEAALVAALLADRPLPDALAAAALDFHGWLALAVQSGLVLGVRVL